MACHLITFFFLALFTQWLESFFRFIIFWCGTDMWTLGIFLLFFQFFTYYFFFAGKTREWNAFGGMGGNGFTTPLPESLPAPTKKKRNSDDFLLSKEKKKRITLPSTSEKGHTRRRNYHGMRRIKKKGREQKGKKKKERIPIVWVAFNAQ